MAAGARYRNASRGGIAATCFFTAVQASSGEPVIARLLAFAAGGPAAGFWRGPSSVILAGVRVL